ncbi:hypothetical protein BLD44_012405 [Mastigocladus laminosus UU774]|nr:hypothetical protein BLD44_012405 [Mastigocladus laminosus UU774]
MRLRFQSQADFLNVWDASLVSDWSIVICHWSLGRDLLNNSPLSSHTSRRDESRLYITRHTPYSA